MCVYPDGADARPFAFPARGPRGAQLLWAHLGTSPAAVANLACPMDIGATWLAVFTQPGRSAGTSAGTSDGQVWVRYDAFGCHLVSVVRSDVRSPAVRHLVQRRLAGRLAPELEAALADR